MQLTLLQKKDLTETLEHQIHSLFSELNADIKQHTLTQIFENEKQIVFVIASENKQIAGMASMAIYEVISGKKGMIEDVVVSKAFRRKGIGRKLIEKLIQEATNLNLSEILLFSGHHREAAIALYKSLGFTLKDSGLYRLGMN